MRTFTIYHKLVFAFWFVKDCICFVPAILETDPGDLAVIKQNTTSIRHICLWQILTTIIRDRVKENCSIQMSIILAFQIFKDLVLYFHVFILY